MVIHCVKWNYESGHVGKKRMFVNSAGLNCFMHVQFFYIYLSIFVYICGHFLLKALNICILISFFTVHANNFIKL